MILSTKYKQVYTAIPKTGTTSIYEVLHNEFGFQVLRISGMQEAGSGYHDSRVVLDWDRFATVRHPYSRTASIWAMAFRKVRFTDFVDLLIHGMVPRVFGRLQHEWLAAGNHTVIKMEALDAGFHSLKFVRDTGKSYMIRRRNKGRYDDPHTADTRRRIRKWAKHDFQLLGYEW